MAKTTDATPKRLIRLRLPVDLIEAIEEIGAHSHRKTADAIEVALMWVARSYSHGRHPEMEMMFRKGGYTCWNQEIRKRREIEELENLFSMSGPSDDGDDSVAKGVIR
jgi:hypothetical protein